MTITPPTPATPATPAPEKMILSPQRKINKPRGEQAKGSAATPQPQKVASDETNWRTKSPNQTAGWDTWQSRREKGGPDRDKWKYIMPASLITTPIPDLTPSDEPDNKFSTPKKVPTLTPQRTIRRSLEQIQKAAASSPLCPPPPMPRSAYKTSPGPKQKEASPVPSKHKERPPVVEKEGLFDGKDLEQEPSFDGSDFPSWDPDTDVNSLWDTLSASKESAIYDVRPNRQSPGFSTEQKVKRPLFTSDDDTSRPSTPRRNRSESVSPERTLASSGECSSPTSAESMTTPLKKKSGSMSESKSARNNSNKSDPRARAESMGSLPNSPHLPRMSADPNDAPNGFENNHVIHSPDFDNADDDDNVCGSPLPLRDISTIIPDTPIADLSPIALSSLEEEILHLSHSNNPSPLATRAIQPFPTFTIEEASIEGDSPVSEKKVSKTGSSAAYSPSSSSTDYASSECFAALASSNNNLEPAETGSCLAPISIPSSPSKPSVASSDLPVQELSVPSPVSAPIPSSPSPPVPLRSSAPMQSQSLPSPIVARSFIQEPSTVDQAQSRQPVPSLLTAVGGVNAFLIVFIAVLFAFLLTDFF
jgi:hypothetical protein